MRRSQARLRLDILEARDLLTTVVHIDSTWVQRAGGNPILLTQAETRYVLDTDVRVAGTAFVVGAPDVTLDLNGHQVVYGDSPPVAVTNGGFELANADGSLPGWNLSRAPGAARAPAVTGMWGNWMLQLNNVATPQTIISDPVALPLVNHEYAAVITPKGTYGATVQLSILDATTGSVLATGVSPNPERGFSPVVSFTPTTHPVRLQIDVIPAAGSTASMALDYAAVVPSRDFGVVASPQWVGQWPAQLRTPEIQAVNRNTSGFAVTGSSLTQGQGRGNASAPLYLQELIGFTVDGVTAVVDGMNTSDVDATWARDGVVRNSTFRGAVDRVPNRMQVVAAVNLANFDGAATVTGNHIAGVPQVGILFNGMPTMQSLSVTNNDIRQDAITTDGYGIVLAGARNFDVGNNTVLPVKGRGILVDGWGRIATENGRVHDNLVDAYEEPNLEYGPSGLEATGLRVRNWDSTHRNLTVANNTFAAHTGPGGVYGAIGVRWSGANDHGQETGANNVLQNNLLKAVVTTTDPHYNATALAVSVVGAGTGLLMAGNVLEGNDTGLSFGDSDSWQSTDEDVSMPGNTIRRSTAGATRPFNSVVAGGYQTTVTNIRLTSTYLENGAPASVTVVGQGVSNIQVDWHPGPPPGGDATGGRGASFPGDGGDHTGDHSGDQTGDHSGDHGSDHSGSQTGDHGGDHSSQSGSGGGSGNGGPRAIFMIAADGQVWTAPPAAGGGWNVWTLTQSGQVKSLSVAYDSNGLAQVFVIGLDDQIYTEAAGPGGAWLAWNRPVPGVVKAISAVSVPGGSQLYVIGLDDQIWAAQNAGGWGGWFLTQPGKVKALTAVADGTGRPEVFVIGLDDQVWAESGNGAGGWGGWTLTQAGAVKALRATTDLAGRAAVFAIGLDDEVWSTLANAAGQGGGWGLTQPGAVKGLGVSADGQGHLEVLAIGQDDQVWCELANAAGGWDGWNPTPAAKATKLAG